jgi:hypothetical protein
VRCTTFQRSNLVRCNGAARPRNAEGVSGLAKPSAAVSLSSVFGWTRGHWVGASALGVDRERSLESVQSLPDHVTGALVHRPQQTRARKPCPTAECADDHGIEGPG